MFDWLRPDVELVTDLTPAEWFSETLEPWTPRAKTGGGLASFMPDGFDSYGRIFHPFELWDGRTSTYRRWADVAAEHGVAINAETYAEQLAGENQEAIVGNFPMEGEIPEAVCPRLVEILGAETTTPATCWFALWSGWGQLHTAGLIILQNPGPSREEREQQQREQRKEEAILTAIPQITPHPQTGRSYLLFRGPVDAACSFDTGYGNVSPSFWWPDDRKWAVVTEIDGRSTYVGGPRRAIDAIIGAEDIEAIEVDRSVRLG